MSVILLKYPTFEGLFMVKTSTKLYFPHIDLPSAKKDAEHKSEKKLNFGFKMYKLFGVKIG